MLANVGKNAQTEKFWEHEMFETCCGNLFFYWNDPPMQKKSIILGHATLRRRKNPLFWDVQPCGAENPEALLPQTLEYAKRRSISVTETLPPKTNQKK